MKKGLIATVVIGLALAVSLSIYTICYAVMGGAHKPSNYEYTIAYRTGDIVKEFTNYSEEAGNLTLTYAEGVEEADYPVVKNEEGNYEVVKEGSLTAVVNVGNGDNITYIINTYAQGDGVNAPYIICNIDHFTEYQSLTTENPSALGYNISIVSDIDLSGVDYRPIGNTTTPFTGDVNGNGYTIYKM